MFPIARMYDSEAKAREAAQALGAARIEAEWITVVSPGPDAAAALARANAGGRVPAGQMGPLTRGLEKGRTVVCASGPMNWGVVIEAALEKAGPVGNDELSPYGGSSASPLSDVLGIPVLTSEQRPWFGAVTSSSFSLSGMFGMPLLTKGGKAMFGGLTSSSFSLSGMFGMPLLTKGGKPMFGSLTSSDFSLSKMLGMPLLTKSGTPFSSFLGMRTLSGRDDS